jgi:hypothetical protein
VIDIAADPVWTGNGTTNPIATGRLSRRSIGKKVLYFRLLAYLARIIRNLKIANIII